MVYSTNQDFARRSLVLVDVSFFYQRQRYPRSSSDIFFNFETAILISYDSVTNDIGTDSNSTFLSFLIYVSAIIFCLIRESNIFFSFFKQYSYLLTPLSLTHPHIIQLRLNSEQLQFITDILVFLLSEVLVVQMIFRFYLN